MAIAKECSRASNQELSSGCPDGLSGGGKDPTGLNRNLHLGIECTIENKLKSG